MDLSVASGGIVPRSPSSRAVLSSSRQAAALIPSTVPPVWKAAAQTGPRAASHALSWARIVARSAAGALKYLLNCAVSIWVSMFSVLAW